MLIPLLRWLAFAFSFSVVLVYFRGGTDLVRGMRESAQRAGGRGIAVLTVGMTGVGAAILVTQLLICLGVLSLPTWADRPWVAIPGALLVIGSVSVAYWIRYGFLGQFWSGHIEIQDGQQVITHGPYAVVRHPLYANTLLIYAGIGLAFPIWWNWLACALMVAGYVVWTAAEDRFLEQNLPGYREYQQQTRYRLLPGIW